MKAQSLVTPVRVGNARARAASLTSVTLAALLLAACPSSRPSPPAESPAPTAPVAAAPRGPASSTSPAPLPAADTAVVDGGSSASDGGALLTEEGERDPGSKMVTIRLLVEPAQRAHVYWGVKDLGIAPLEIRRPRGSGPLDLVLRAPGYLAFHTRVFTDRDDRLSVRLVPIAEASAVFGYRAPQPLDR